VALCLYNTQARAKELFEPLDPENVRMYVCGPTVYARAHIGNARPVIVFDVLYRLLRLLYGDQNVTYVRNITDIDDKIIAAAEESGEPISALTERFTKAFHEDMAPLGTLAPDFEPRATHYIPQMVRMVEALLERGHAYEAEGHVLFHIATMKGYGELSRRGLDDMIAGARVEVAPYKKHAADFVLWKPSPPEMPGWDSPWGRGRPGWHLECSAMSKELLGTTFDIHGGGQDLIFPHHENERAQSICVHDGAPFARYWVHNGYLIVEGEKMSKSLGNIRTVRQLLDQGHRGETIRFLTLSKHYRKELDWTEAGLREAKSELDYLYKPLWMAREAGIKPGRARRLPARISEALYDDLNTPLALSRLHQLAHELHNANAANDRAKQERVSAELLAAGRLLGLLREDAEMWFKEKGIVMTPAAATAVVDAVGPTVVIGPPIETIEAKIAERNAAREKRDFAAADKIRDELAQKGIVLEDLPDGTIWRMAG
jgi:cysteinyl-tRNA synthetase